MLDLNRARPPKGFSCLFVELVSPSPSWALRNSLLLQLPAGLNTWAPLSPALEFS